MEKNRLTALPEEMSMLIYKHVFDGCLEELKNYYPNWKWRFNQTYTCCDNQSYNVFVDGCLFFSYPDKFPFRCCSCMSRMCNKCWVRSRRDARAHRASGYQGWCNSCIWNDIG